MNRSEKSLRKGYLLGADIGTQQIAEIGATISKCMLPALCAMPKEPRQELITERGDTMKRFARLCMVPHAHRHFVEQKAIWLSHLDDQRVFWFGSRTYNQKSTFWNCRSYDDSRVEGFVGNWTVTESRMKNEFVAVYEAEEYLSMAEMAWVHHELDLEAFWDEPTNKIQDDANKKCMIEEAAKEALWAKKIKEWSLFRICEIHDMLYEDHCPEHIEFAERTPNALRILSRTHDNVFPCMVGGVPCLLVARWNDKPLDVPERRMESTEFEDVLHPSTMELMPWDIKILPVETYLWDPFMRGTRFIFIS